MFKFRNHLLAAAAVGAMAAGFAAQASATVVTLNPSGSTPALSGNGPFNTDNGTIIDNGLVDVNSAGGFTESGNFSVTSFNLGTNSIAGTGVNTAYQIWGTFSATGSGTIIGNNLVLGTVTSFTVTLSGNSGLGTTFVVPTTIGTFGVTPSGTAFPLGSASLIAGTGTASATAIGTAAQTASISATDVFSSQPSQTGAGKFFEAPIPFNIDILAAATATSNVITQVACSNGDPLCFQIAGGGGNISFETAAIPEPASLALFSIGLFGLGAALRRKNRKA